MDEAESGRDGSHTRVYATVHTSAPDRALRPPRAPEKADSWDEDVATEVAALDGFAYGNALRIEEMGVMREGAARVA